MIELEYVKKRKRKKLAAIISAIASLGIGVFVLVSFLGRFVGTFTVALNMGTVKMSLANKSDFESPTSFIKIDSLPSFGGCTYTTLPSDEELDSENTSYLDYANYNKDHTQVLDVKFFKYTFFVKNTGDVTSYYDLSVNITTNTASLDGTGRTIDQIIRVKVYENDGLDPNDHSKSHVYAQKSSAINYDENGNPTEREFISYSLDKCQEDGIPFPGFADTFESNSVIATLPNPNFEPNAIKRYTIVLWIEGEDPQTKGEAPEGAKLKLGVTINAYENK